MISYTARVKNCIIKNKKDFITLLKLNPTFVIAELRYVEDDILVDLLIHTHPKDIIVDRDIKYPDRFTIKYQKEYSVGKYIEYMFYFNNRCIIKRERNTEIVMNLDRLYSITTRKVKIE